MHEPPQDPFNAGDSLTRRDFLKLLSTSFAALSLVGCKLRPPKEKIIPFLQQPEESVPGLASWYASTCSGCPAACGVLAKSRDGRPIKLEGNPDHPLSRGGLCARGQATVLDLYDSQRLRTPWQGASPISWAQADAAIIAKLKKSDAIRIVSRTVSSPSLLAALEKFKQRFPAARHIVYEPLSSSAIVEAHHRTHGQAVLPHYHFDRARVIVSFDADFLGTWISPVEFIKDWSANRRLDKERGLMSWHAQFEPRLSLTGTNADLRRPLKPSQEFATLAALGRMVARRVGWQGPLPPEEGAPGVAESLLEHTAGMLTDAKRRSLVVSGSQDPDAQMLVNWINVLLDNYGSTLDIERPSRQNRSDDAAMDQLIEEMKRGQVSALLCLDANPAYDHPRAADFVRAMGRVQLSIALADRKDETAALCGFLCPLSHSLESWGDAEPVPGVLSLQQPLLSPIFESRSALETLLRWSGQSVSAYDFVKEHWRQNVFSRRKGKQGFTSFWDEALRRGAVTVAAAALPAGRFVPDALSRLKPARRPAKSGDFELVPYASTALGDGRQANNPWLQELPDPMSRVSWGNYASFSPGDAQRLGLEEGRVVRLSVPGRQAELPVHIQTGQAEGVVAAALGYGRKNAGPIAANHPMVKMLPLERDLLGGADLYAWLKTQTVSVTVTPGRSPLAKVQIYDSLTDPLMGQKRPFVRETTLQEYVQDPRSGNPEVPEEKGLWPRHEYKGHKWGMAVDLNSCMGCGACVVGCQAENNVPVVGKAEVRKSRDMAWIRIDRYYEDDRTSFQPILCQHCDNAPCETVCPVLASVHSTEGLSMQVYNRCVGTRYCSNNCPYKVRRFNWFDYAHQDLVQNMALNPDVTVRSRGVMEKCSFCVQRIYSAKFQAKQEGRQLKDGDVIPACAQSCPADALVFGDLNDPNSRVSRLARDSRSYRVLAELGVGPSIFYRTKVRNRRV